MTEDDPTSPSYARHLMTVEAGPADGLDPDCADYEFVSRCICGHDIPWGPFDRTLTAMCRHLVSAGMLDPGEAEAAVPPVLHAHAAKENASA